MIKILNRFIFALLAAIGVLLVFNLTDSYHRTLQLEEMGREALANNDYDFFVSVRYYNKVPIVDEIITEGERTFSLKIYEVAYIKLIEEEYVVTDGIHLIIHQTAGEPLYNFFSIRFEADNVPMVQYLGVKLFSLPVYSAINEETKASIIKKDTFMINDEFQTITKMEIFQEDEVFTSIPLGIEGSVFSIRAEIESYIQEHNEPPSQAFDNVSMAPVIHINNIAVVLRNIAIYFLGMIVLTLVVFKARKRLGRKEPTIGVKKDIEKINKT